MKNVIINRTRALGLMFLLVGLLMMWGCNTVLVDGVRKVGTGFTDAADMKGIHCLQAEHQPWGGIVWHSAR